MIKEQIFEKKSVHVNAFRLMISHHSFIGVPHLKQNVQ